MGRNVLVADTKQRFLINNELKLLNLLLFPTFTVSSFPYTNPYHFISSLYLTDKPCNTVF